MRACLPDGSLEGWWAGSSTSPSTAGSFAPKPCAFFCLALRAQEDWELRAAAARAPVRGSLMPNYDDGGPAELQDAPTQNWKVEEGAKVQSIPTQNWRPQAIPTQNWMPRVQMDLTKTGGRRMQGGVLHPAGRAGGSTHPASMPPIPLNGFHSDSRFCLWVNRVLLHSAPSRQGAATTGSHTLPSRRRAPRR